MGNNCSRAPPADALNHPPKAHTVLSSVLAREHVQFCDVLRLPLPHLLPTDKPDVSQEQLKGLVLRFPRAHAGDNGDVLLEIEPHDIEKELLEAEQAAPHFELSEDDKTLLRRTLTSVHAARVPVTGESDSHDRLSTYLNDFLAAMAPHYPGLFPLAKQR